MKQKWIKKLVALTSAFTMMFALSLPAAAEGGSGSGTGGTEPALPPGVIAEVTFTNAPTHQPDLYVEKKVTCDDPNETIPDQTFEFEIWVETTDAAGKKKLAPYANEIYSIQGKVDEKTEKTRKTDENGAFFLKADQKALFEYVGNGKQFQIKELPATNFEVSSPIGGTASGIVEKNGTNVSFTNRYVPPTPPSPPDTPSTLTKGSLKVEKKISWPTGYIYASETEEMFEFTLKVGNVPATAEVYDLYNTETGASQLNAGQTDSEGKFSIPAGYYASFESLAGDEDYEVVESPKAGWHEVNATVHKGSTSAKNKETFVNTNASFTVKKSITGEKTDKEFTFELLDGKGALWAGAEYWLYSGTDRVVEADGKYKVCTTNSKGQFTLKQNQAAVFVGILPNSVYTVRELTTEGYEQKVPLSSAGYTSQSVADSGTSVLPFENKPIDPTGSLTVTKALVYDGEDGPLNDPYFTFTISQKKADGSYEPLADATYTIGSDGSKLKTAKDGKFKLKAREIAIFATLPLNYTYKVTEDTGTLMPAGYHLTPGKEASYEGKLTVDGLNFTISNTYEARKLKLKIVKYANENDGSESMLDGAEFGLYYDTDCTVPVETKEQDGVMVPVTYTTKDGGVIEISDLREATYYLKELKPPAGYASIPGMVRLTIERKIVDDVETFVAKVDSLLEKATIDESSSNVVIDESSVPVMTLRICDDPVKNYTLPSTGGIGTYLFTILGSALFLISVFWMLEDKRKKLV